MNKTFENWNKLKINLNETEKNINFHEREIWYISMWENIWFEQNWKWENFLRPVLVLKKLGNMFWTVAMISKGKDNNFYYKINDLDLQNPKYKDSSYLILSQVKVMDKKRFFENVGMVHKDEFKKIQEKLKTFLF